MSFCVHAYILVYTHPKFIKTLNKSQLRKSLMLVFFLLSTSTIWGHSIYIYIYITVTDTSLVNFTLWTLSVGDVVLLSFTIVKNYCYHDCNQTFKLIFFPKFSRVKINLHKKRHHSKYDRTKQMLWHQNISTLTLSISQMN